MQRIDLKDIKTGQYYLIRNIGGTDSWAIGSLHSIDPVAYWLSFNEDDIQPIEHDNMKEAHIYLLHTH